MSGTLLAYSFLAAVLADRPSDRRGCPARSRPSFCYFFSRAASFWPARHYLRVQFMQAAGDVKSATVIRYPDGRSKGWGLVEFESATGAQEAIANYNDVELMGRKIFIREDRETGDAGGLPAPGGGADGGKGGGKGRGRGARSGRGSRARPPLEEPAEEVTSGTALFVGNLPWSTTSQQLKEVRPRRKTQGTQPWPLSQLGEMRPCFARWTSLASQAQRPCGMAAAAPSCPCTPMPSLHHPSLSYTSMSPPYACCPPNVSRSSPSTT